MPPSRRRPEHEFSRPADPASDRIALAYRAGVAARGAQPDDQQLHPDAAELVNTLRDNPAAVAKIEEWYSARMNAKLIEHEAAN
jgi:hypothetical protein